MNHQGSTPVSSPTGVVFSVRNTFVHLAEPLDADASEQPALLRAKTLPVMEAEDSLNTCKAQVKQRAATVQICEEATELGDSDEFSGDDSDGAGDLPWHFEIPRLQTYDHLDALILEDDSQESSSEEETATESQTTSASESGVCVAESASDASIRGLAEAPAATGASQLPVFMVPTIFQGTQHMVPQVPVLAPNSPPLGPMTAPAGAIQMAPMLAAPGSPQLAPAPAPAVVSAMLAGSMPSALQGFAGATAAAGLPQPPFLLALSQPVAPQPVPAGGSPQQAPPTALPRDDHGRAAALSDALAGSTASPAPLRLADAALSQDTSSSMAHRRGSSKVKKSSDVTQRTTVMLRNLPNNYTRDTLLDLIDSLGLLQSVDFCYFPIDFRTHAALGYSFINLVTPAEAERLRNRLDGFCDWVFPSCKTCNVGWSHPHQGLEAHVERYRNSPLMHEDVPDEYRPVLLSNGRRIPFPAPTKRIKPPRQGTQRMLV